MWGGVNDLESAPKPRLEFGQLHTCSNCRRRKAEPRATRCPDCLAMARLASQYNNELERMYRNWTAGKRMPPPGPFLADDPDFLSFKTRDELMQAYNRWLG